MGNRIFYEEEVAASKLRHIGATIRHDSSDHVSEVLLSQRRAVTDASLADLLPLKQLKKLYLDDTTVGNDGMRAVGKVSSIQVLVLTDCKRINDDGVSELAPLHNMVELGLSGISISDSGLRYLVGMRHLECLYLDETNVSDDGLSHLANMSTLRILSLIKTKITDAGLVHLQGLSNLEQLKLVSKAVTDQSVDVLKTFHQLQRLMVQATKITESGARALKAALPTTEIWHPAL